MKPIEAQDQARLGVARCVRLAVSGMSYRLLRSGITTAILALAVAFLVHALTHAILAERVQRSAWDALEPTRSANAWLSHLTTPASPSELRDQVTGQGSAERSEQFLRWLDKDRSALNTLDDVARQMKLFTLWTESLDPATAAVLLGGQEPAQVLQTLIVDPAERDRFVESVGSFHRADPFQEDERAWDRLAAVWPVYLETVDRLTAAHTRAIEAFRRADERPVLSRFAQPKPTLREELADAGFMMTEAESGALRVFARGQALIAEIQSRLQDNDTSAKVNADLGTTELPAVMTAIAQDKPADWWPLVLPDRVDVDDATLTARWFLTQQRFADITQGYEPAYRETPFGLPVGTLWLVGLSLLVCVVGVTNALLMSVTERFNEIATMKCLGAMDRSIMQMFVAEAVIQGVIGGAVGVVLGLLLTLLRGFAEFGTLMGRGLEGWSQLLTASALSLGVGVLLAALAAVGPSWIASRLAPMEAMRVE
ncbi:MAG: ABC transporter permease [Planctomycetota bacterium]